MFNELNIKHYRFKDKNEKLVYYVYKNDDDFVEIEAESASDAVVKSEIAEPKKILQKSIITKFANFEALEEYQPEPKEDANADSEKNNVSDADSEKNDKEDDTNKDSGQNDSEENSKDQNDQNNDQSQEKTDSQNSPKTDENTESNPSKTPNETNENANTAEEAEQQT